MKENKSTLLWQGFWQLADPKIWIASTVPIIIGTALAFNLRGKFNFLSFILSLIGIYLIEIGKNAINEVIDYNTGVDCFVSRNNRTPFSGGKKTIVDGLLTVKEVKTIAILTMAAGAFLGIYISFTFEFKIFYVGIIGFLLAILYSLPPVKLAYRGLGELTVGLTFGPLIVIGSYLVQAHNFSLEVLLVSLPVGFLIANVLWINQYPDYEADKKGNKRNWVVRMGRKKANIMYILLFSASYAALTLVFVLFNNPVWLLPFLSLPLTFSAIKVALKYYNNIPKLITANARTIQIYVLTGVTMVLAAILDKIIA